MDDIVQRAGKVIRLWGGCRPSVYCDEIAQELADAGLLATERSAAETVVNTFSGIGWDFAAEELGLDVHGIDIEPTVADTRTKLGWSTTTADILHLEPSDWAGADGLIASPPCQSWSRAGKGAGLDDPRGQLVWQPLVWALAIRPRWVACEQVPEARGAFELIAHRLREAGYHADTYELSAECFGVPQTRRRVFMVAHRDRAPHRPQPTHQRFKKGRARVEPVDMLGLLPWVSMAEAVGNGSLDTRCGGKSQWVLRQGRGAGMTERHGERPDRSLDEPASTLTGPLPSGRTRLSWAFSRPSTTVCADPRVSPPVHHDGSQSAGAVAWADAGTDKPIALTEAQGCRLMSFPDHAVDALCGNKADRWRIIGNAVAPPVGKAVLSTLVEA